MQKNIDDIFLMEEPVPYFMDKHEYLKRTQQLFSDISDKYCKSWCSRQLLVFEYPEENICDKCKGVGQFEIGGEVKECFQDKEGGDCYHRYLDSEEFGTEVEVQLEELFSLLGVDGLK